MQCRYRKVKYLIFNCTVKYNPALASIASKLPFTVESEHFKINGEDEVGEGQARTCKE